MAFLLWRSATRWLDDKGEAAGYFDVHDYIGLRRAHYTKVGLGAEAIDRLMR
jgi:2,4'-dihydroxyacetophenone dioxygenase